jgi:hypothetical protein
MSGKVTTLPNTNFTETSVTIRGTEYKLRELSAGQYDDAVRSAETSSGEVDSVLLLRLMLIDSLVEPALSPDQINELPYRVIRVLNRAVNELHWSPEAEEAKNA